MMERLRQFLLAKSQQICLGLRILDSMIQLKGWNDVDTFPALVLTFLLKEDVQLVEYPIAGNDVDVCQIGVVGLTVLPRQVSQVILREGSAHLPVVPRHLMQTFGLMVLLEEFFKELVRLNDAGIVVRVVGMGRS